MILAKAMDSQCSARNDFLYSKSRFTIRDNRSALAAQNDLVNLRGFVGGQ